MAAYWLEMNKSLQWNSKNEIFWYLVDERVKNHQPFSMRWLARCVRSAVQLYSNFRLLWGSCCKR